MKKLKPLLLTTLMFMLPFGDGAASAHPPDESDHVWQIDPGATFYGPGFYGKTTFCGQRMTPDSKWVAVRNVSIKPKAGHITCGTHVRFEHDGAQIVVQVLDRCGGCTGNHKWDLSAGTCHWLKINSNSGRERCNKNPIAYTF